MKYLILTLIFILSPRAWALKLELNAGVDADIRSYDNLIYKNKQKDFSYHSDNTYINFVIKQIVLEKAENSKMDVFVGIKNVGVDKTSSTVNSAYLNENLSFYPQINSPFINQAYAKVYNFYKEGINAYFGKQSYTLGQGIVLSDCGRGFDGLRFDFTDYLGINSAETFIFRDTNKQDNIYKIYGLNIQQNGFDGTWQAYFLNQKRSGAAEEINLSAENSNKNFAGIRYFTSKNQLAFDGEYVIQSGSSDEVLTGNKVKYKGYAFLLKGQWKQNMPLLGPTRTRLSYGKSSGDSGSNAKENKAFYADLGYRYDGVNRSGFGQIFSASLYDVFRTSDTANGLPSGISGLNIINFGFDWPYKKMLFSVDYIGFRAAENISNPGTFKIGTETDIKAEYKLGEKFSLFAVYAYFNSDSALGSLKTVKMTSLAIKAKF
ncbi:MAG: hypothetical protein AB1637_05895 [Elusimicrobiota bacterium]